MVDSVFKILILEDQISDVELVKHLISRSEISAEFVVVDNKKDFEKKIKEFKPDIILSDHNLPNFNSVEALKIYKNYYPQINYPTVFILVTGTVSEEFAVSVIQEGADDYILKDRMQRLPLAILQAFEKNKEKFNKKLLAKEQERLLYHIELLLKSTKEGIYGIDLKGNCTFINDAALQMIGYSREECIQKNMHKLIHSKKSDQRNYPESDCPIKLTEITQTSCTISNEVFWKKDGSFFHVEYHASPIIEKSKVVGAVVIFSDISKRIQESKLKEINYNITNIFLEEESMDHCLENTLREFCISVGKYIGEAWITNIDESALRLAATFSLHNHLNIEANQNEIQLGEGVVGEVLKNGKFIFIPNIQEYNIYLRKEYAIKNNFYSAYFFPIKFKLNTIAVFAFYDTHIAQADTSFISLFESCISNIADNIHRKKTEVQLKNIFDHSPDLICIIGKDNLYKKVNQAFQTILGYSEPDLLGLHFTDIVHEADVEHSILNSISLENSLQKVQSFTNRLIGKNGHEHWFNWTYQLIQETDFYLAIAKDITNKVLLEKELEEEKLRKQLAITDAVIVAQERERKKIGLELHDNVCQLLATAKIYIALAKKDIKSGKVSLEQVEALVDKANFEIRGLSHALVPRLIDENSLEDALEELAMLTEHSSQLKISLKFLNINEREISDDLKLTFYRIIQEQLQNIIKYAQTNRVKIVLQKKKNHYHLLIEDKGVGFDVNAKRNGIGILNIQTRAMVYNGSVKITSALGKGCLLEVLIPTV
ncbi:MAG: PAS domain S-box protein [Chitinophagaceae bacterium]|nr:PAS domain S-box protein [Chitinophagaceae bacterium]